MPSASGAIRERNTEGRMKRLAGAVLVWESDKDAKRIARGRKLLAWLLRSAQAFVHGGVPGVDVQDDPGS